MKPLHIVTVGVAASAAAFLGYLLATSQPAPSHPFFEPAPSGTTEVIAHRGGAGLRPENTLAAFTHAVQLGADILEMDVHLSSDGELVVIHDATVDRTTQASGAVATLSRQELSRLDAGYRFSPDGQDFPYRGLGIRIPTLREVFAAHGSKRMVVEMKSRGERTAAALCTLVREAGMTMRVLAASFDGATLAGFRQACPEVASALSATEARTFVVAALLQVERMSSPVAPALLIPDRLRYLELSARVQRSVGARNLHLYVWTVNDESRMRELLEMRIGGVMTDRPDRLLALRAAVQGR